MSQENETPRARIGGWAKFSNKLSQSTDIYVAAQGKKCLDKLTVYLQRNMQDKLTPIDMSLDFALVEEAERTHYGV